MNKRIQDIAPLLAENFIDFETDSLMREKYCTLIVNNSLRLGLYYRYLNNLHDSWIIGTKMSEATYSLTLNDFKTHVFADTLISKKGLKFEHDKLIFPIQIDFEINDLTFNTVDDDGFISKIKPTRIDEYLYEQILTVDSERIEIALGVWKNNKRKLGQQILVLIDSKSILVSEY